MKPYNRTACPHCGKMVVNGHLKRHIPICHVNPINLIECAVCGKPTKGGETCSHSCSNIHKPKREATNYRTICFKNHDKKCIVCDEEKIVEVHHNDCDKTNNDPNNLIPLCPTHHQYIHSRYKDEVQPHIDKYIDGRV